MNRYCYSLLCAGALVAVRASAEEPSASTNQPMPEIVVTATRTPTPTEQIGSAVTVITHEQIEQSQATTVVDLLREVPALNVVQAGRPGGQTSVFLRGANSNQSLFLIDGARVDSPLNGLVTLANLTPDQIERIEIVSGPQSTLYGSDAMGGVINIITRKGTGQPTGSASLEGGSHGMFRQSGDISGSYSNFDYALSLSHLATDNIFRNDDTENLTVGGTLGYRLSQQARLSSTVRYTTADSGVPGAITNGTPSSLTERLQDEVLFGRVGLDLTVFDWWQQNLFVSENHESLLDRKGEFGPSTSHTDVIEVGWQNTFPVTEWNTVTAGLDWHRDSGDFSGFGTTFDANVENWAGYVQDQITLWKRLTLTGGGRFDSNNQFGDKATYRFAGVLQFPETGTRLKASVGSGFRAPDLNELFYPGSSNPDLKPEVGIGFDAGIEQDILSDKATLGARYFENDFKDLVSFQFVPPTSFVPFNISRARTDGVETFAQARPITNLTVRASYTYLLTRDLATGDPLLRRPKNSGSVGADYHFWKRFGVHTEALFVGPCDDISPVTFGTVRNAGHVQWNLGGSVDITKNLQLFGRIENLLDDRYEESRGYPALGRVFYAGGKARF